MDIGNFTLSTDLMVGFAAGVGVALIRGLIVKALIGAATVFLLLGGTEHVDFNSLYRTVMSYIP